MNNKLKPIEVIHHSKTQWKLSNYLFNKWIHSSNDKERFCGENDFFILTLMWVNRVSMHGKPYGGHFRWGVVLEKVMMKLITLIWNMEFHFYTITSFQFDLTWFKYCSSVYHVHAFQVFLSQHITVFKNKSVLLQGDEAEEVGSHPVARSLSSIHLFD